MYSHQDYQILRAVADERPVTQRVIASELGIALGLANLRVKRLTERGCIEVIRQPGNHLEYRITERGFEEKARLESERLQQAIAWYGEARSQLRDGLERLSREWPSTEDGPGCVKPIVFYGTGILAEIAFVSLQETDLSLVGVVDHREGSFFGLPVHHPSRLSGLDLAGSRFERLVVTTIGAKRIVRAELAEQGVRDDQIFFLEKPVA